MEEQIQIKVNGKVVIQEARFGPRGISPITADFDWVGDFLFDVGDKIVLGSVYADDDGLCYGVFWGGEVVSEKDGDIKSNLINLLGNYLRANTPQYLYK